MCNPIHPLQTLCGVPLGSPVQTLPSDHGHWNAPPCLAKRSLRRRLLGAGCGKLAGASRSGLEGDGKTTSHRGCRPDRFQDTLLIQDKLGCSKYPGFDLGGRGSCSFACQFQVHVLYQVSPVPNSLYFWASQLSLRYGRRPEVLVRQRLPDRWRPSELNTRVLVITVARAPSRSLGRT